MLIIKYSEKSYEIYLDDLILMLTSEVTINSLDVLASEKTIEITISGTTRLDLEEYVLSIYEAYGISNLETDETRWIALPPTIKVISELVLEVTINHVNIMYLGKKLSKTKALPFMILIFIGVVVGYYLLNLTQSQRLADLEQRDRFKKSN